MGQFCALEAWKGTVSVSTTFRVGCDLMRSNLWEQRFSLIPGFEGLWSVVVGKVRQWVAPWRQERVVGAASHLGKRGSEEKPMLLLSLRPLSSV